MPKGLAPIATPRRSSRFVAGASPYYRGRMASVWVIAGSAGETNQLPAAEANQLPAAEATPQNPSVTTIYFALGPWGLPSSMFGWIWRPVHYKCVGK